MASSSQSGAPVPSEYLRRRTGQLSGCGPGTAAGPALAGRTRVRLSPCPAADRGPMTDPGPTTQLTRTERLDRLPFTRAHGKLLGASGVGWALDADRKSTRLNSSHVANSYAVFCLKKKKTQQEGA